MVTPLGYHICFEDVNRRERNNMTKTNTMVALRRLLVPCFVLSSVIAIAQDSQSKRRFTRLSATAPKGSGQLETAPALFRGGVDDQGREFFLNGQLAQASKLILTASNGFFDNGTCRAAGESSLPKIADDLRDNQTYHDSGGSEREGRDLLRRDRLPDVCKTQASRN